MVIVVATLVACNRSNDEPARTSSVDAAPAPTASSASRPVRKEALVYADTTTSITSAVGERFVIALPGSTATPFEWKLDGVPSAAVIALTSETASASPPAGCAGCGGYGGSFDFAFEAQGAGTTKLHFVYVRAVADGAPPAKEVTIDVRVR